MAPELNPKHGPFSPDDRFNEAPQREDLFPESTQQNHLLRQQQKQVLGLEPIKNETFFDKLLRMEVFKVNLARLEGQKFDPDKVRRMMRVRLATNSRLPNDLIAKNLDTLERQIENDRFDVAEFIKRSPITANWVREHDWFKSLPVEQIQSWENLEQFINRPRGLWRKPTEMLQDSARKRAEYKMREYMQDATAIPGPNMLSASGLRQINALLKGGPTAIADPKNFQEAMRETFYQEELNRLRDIEDYIASDTPVGYGEAVRFRFHENPYFLIPFVSGIVDMQEAEKMYWAARAMENDQATEEQREYLVDVGRMALASERRGTDVFGDIGNILSNLPAFAGEFASTGPIYSSAKGAVLKGGREWARSWIRRRVLKAVAFGAGSSSQMLAASPARMVKSTVERMTPGGQVELRDGTVAFNVLPGTGEPFTVAFPRAIVDSWAEIASERAGGMALFRWMDKAVNRLLFQSWLKKFPSGTRNGFQKLIRAGGIHGVLGEIGEEELAKMIKDLGDAGPPYALPFTPGGTTPSEFAAQAVSFSIFPFLSGATSTFGRRAQDSRKYTNPQWFKDLGDLVKKVDPEGKNPDIVERFVRDATRGTGMEFSILPLKTWTSYWQSQKDDLGFPRNPRTMFMAHFGNVEAYDEAVQSGADLVVPTSAYAVNIAGTEHNEFFQSEVRLDPEEWNSRESREEAEERDQQSEEQEAPVPEGEKGKEATAPVRATAPTQEEVSTQRIYDSVVEEMTRANLQQLEGLRELTPQDIERLAGVTAERARRRAEVLGVDPYELYKSEGRTFRVLREEGIGPEDVTQPGERGARGRAKIGPGGIEIGFLKNADVSTFFHETGHVWLLELKTDVGILAKRPADQLTREQKQLLEDGQVILKFLGLESFDQLTPENKDITEKFAKATEVYFAEGKAPTPKLIRAFRTFRAWMNRLYRDLFGLGVTLTQDVRNVMDRMLASEEEVTIARTAQNLVGMLPEPEFVGMTEKQAEKIRTVLDEAYQDAIDTVAQRVLQKLQRKRSRQWREERKQVRRDVAEELGNQEVYRAFSVLSKGVLPDGTAFTFPSGMKPYKLSIPQIRAEQGDAVLKTLPKSVLSQAGISPQIAAEDFGFESADELLMALNEIFEQERQASPVFQQETEILRRIEELQAQSRAIEAQEQVLGERTREEKKRLRAGRPALVKRLKEALVRQEKDAVAGVQEELKGIRDAGGIRPAVQTKRIPKAYRPREKGKGVPSDELAQEFFDRNLIADPTGDSLYDWLESALSTVKASNERIKEIEGSAEIQGEAERVAGRMMTESIEALVRNIEAQTLLREDLKEIRKKQRAVEREIEVKGSIDNIIDRVTDARMDALHPELETMDELREEAVRVVHSEKQGELIKAEMDYLLSEEFSTFKKLTKAIIGPARSLTAYRAEAEQVVARKKVGEIIPAVYQRAASRAGKEASQAFLNGQFQASFELKEQQLKSHELYRAALKAQREIDRIIKFLRKFEKRSVQVSLGRAGASYLQQILQILDGLELRRLTAREEERRQHYRDWVAEQEALGLAPIINEEVFGDARRKNFREIPVGELFARGNQARNIAHLAQFKNKLLRRKEKREFDELKAFMRESFEKNSKGPRPVRVERLPRHELLRKGAAFLGMNAKFSNLAQQLDGWADTGVASETFIFPADQAANAESQMNQEASTKLQELFAVFGVGDVAKMYTPVHIPELGIGVSKMGQIMMALNWGNLDSRMKLMEGLGISLRLPGPVNESQVDAVLRRLDERDWKFVQAVLDYFETFWPQIQELSRRVDGIAVEKVEAEQIVTRFGTFRGGYFPLKYDERQSSVTQQQTAEEVAQEQLRGARFRATTKQGHRKARVEGVRRPVKLDFSVIFRHVQEVIHDLTHYEYLVDVNRLLSDRDIQNTIREFYGDIHLEEMKAAVKDIAAGHLPATNVYEEMANSLRRGTTTAVLGFKVTTALLQPLGILNSIVRIGPKWVVRGFERWLGDADRMSKTVEWIREVSEFMRQRDRTMTREVSEIEDQLRLRGKVFSKIESWALWMTVKAQLFADIPTWLGQYEKSMEELGAANAKSEEERKEIEEKAILIADRAVIDSQGGGHIKDLSRIQRGNAFVKLFTMFSTFFNARWNLARRSVLKTDFKSGEDLGRLAGDMFMLYPMPAVLAVLSRELLRGGLGEDDKGELVHDLMTDALLEPLTDVIGLRELVGPLKGFRYRGPAGLKAIGEIGDLAVQIGQGEMDRGLVRELNDAAGPLFHYPSEQIEAIFKGFWAWDEGKGGPGAILLGPPRKRGTRR